MAEIVVAKDLPNNWIELLDAMGWDISEPIPYGENYIYTIKKKDGK